jgi:cation transport ATPase
MSATVFCPSCGKPVDTLRAGAVAILDGGFRYFCDAACKRAYVQLGSGALPSQTVTADPPPVAPAVLPATVVYDAPVPPPRDERPLAPSPLAASPPASQDVVREGRTALLAEESPPSSAPSAPAREPPVHSAVALTVDMLTLLGISLGCLAPAVGLLGAHAQGWRLVLATAAVLACAGRATFAPRDPSDVHPLVALFTVVAVWVVAAYASTSGEPRALTYSAVAGIVAAAHLTAAVAVDRTREGVRTARSWIARRLDVPVRVVKGDLIEVVSATEVKPGEAIAATVGDVLGVDARVTAGEAVVTPWLDAPIDSPKRDGDAIVAGARVVSGSLRGVTTWSGADRAWLKLADSTRMRPDVVAPLARRVRVGVERGTVVVAAVVAGLGMANGARGLDLVAMASVAAFSVAGTWAVGVAAIHQARGPLSALAHGIVYRDALAFDRAGLSDIAVLAARSVLLMGAPEIVVLEAVGAFDERRVLALAAGASVASANVAGEAILSAARARQETPESVRHATYHAGLGVTALVANGDRLVVGSRALLLREKVSVAVADSRVTELESEGKSVTLVARGGKVVGLLAMQDGLSPGARGAVQRLLDAGLEPVLLSGEARDMCETLGRAVDIEHIRPEVLPEDRGDAVRALADGGRVVAVLGRPERDGSALAAADVSVALGAAGASPGEWSIALASDDVRDAARALSIAIESRDRTKVAIGLGLAPGAVAALGVGLGVLPLAVAPILSLAGLAAAVVHARR